MRGGGRSRCSEPARRRRLNSSILFKQTPGSLVITAIRRFQVRLQAHLFLQLCVRFVGLCVCVCIMWLVSCCSMAKCFFSQLVIPPLCSALNSFYDQEISSLACSAKIDFKTPVVGCANKIPFKTSIYVFIKYLNLWNRSNGGLLAG